MTARRTMNPELAAAAAKLAEAAQDVRQAVSQKVDEIGASVSAEIDKAKHNRIRLYQSLGGGFATVPEVAAVALPLAT
jgi:hypothetical protein